MKRVRFYLILIGCIIAATGLIGPAAFVESMGRLSLHQLTFAARSANIPNSDIYLWLSLFFSTLLLLILLASFYQKYKITGVISFFGIFVWSISVILYHQWRTQELERVKSFGDINSLDHMAYTVFLQGLNLQWGIYLVLCGIVLILSFSLIGINRNKV